MPICCRKLNTANQRQIFFRTSQAHGQPKGRVDEQPAQELPADVVRLRLIHQRLQTLSLQYRLGPLFVSMQPLRNRAEPIHGVFIASVLTRSKVFAPNLLQAIY